MKRVLSYRDAAETHALLNADDMDQWFAIGRTLEEIKEAGDKLIAENPNVTPAEFQEIIEAWYAANVFPALEEAKKIWRADLKEHDSAPPLARAASSGWKIGTNGDPSKVALRHGNENTGIELRISKRTANRLF